MELLEKETFYYECNEYLIEPVNCAFLLRKSIEDMKVIVKQYWHFLHMLIGHGVSGHQNLCLD
ncbi:hypothetical protein ACFC6A_11480 [Enterococcus hirae]